MNLVERAKSLLLNPKAEWPVIDSERPTTQELYTSYVMILAAIGPIASLIGMSVFGIEIPFVGRIRTPVMQGVTTAVVTYGLSLVMLYVLSRIINWLAPRFGGLSDPMQALKVAAYACTAAWVGGIFSLFPSLSIFGLLAGLYSLYLLYTGLPVLMKSSPDRSFGYTAGVVVLSILLMIPVAGVFMFFTSALHAPTVDVSADPAATEALQQLESFTKKLEQAGRDMADTTEPSASGRRASDQSEQNGTPSRSASQSEQDIQQAAQAVGAMLQAMGKSSGDEKSVAAADFRVLKALLPESVPGMERSSATGGREAMMGIDHSQAKAIYTGPDHSRIEIEVVDFGGNLGMVGLAAFSWAASGAVIDRETEHGYERTLTYRGHKAWEEYDRADRSGKLSVMVNSHAGVTVRGQGVPAEVLREALDRVDLDGVALARAT
ncbi:hypothetical protein YTPLAS18_10810 [Nitrospira sp.]|nr:hypothetical protein YTPLAS18_10810 [Nitrospira sp.]